MKNTLSSLITNGILLKYDSESNQYVITNSGKEITIRVDELVNFIFDKDISITANSQLDVVSYLCPICIDTVDNFLFFNSKRSKQLKSDLKVKYTPEQIDKIKSSITSHTDDDSILSSEITIILKNLLNRISNLEQQIEELKKEIKNE